MTETLYNRAIIQAGRDPTHTGRLTDPDATATADNPLCGDRVTLDLEATNGTITALGHTTRGCLLTKAAAALLTRHAHGRPLAEAQALQRAAKAYLEGECDEPPFPELAVMAPVKAVKSRHDCVTIAFDALAAAAASAASGPEQQE
jgi:nitrogen fixation protein NifU and related proteins